MEICGGGLPPCYAVRRQHASVQVDHLVGGLGGGLAVVVVVVDRDEHGGVPPACFRTG